MNLYFSHKSKAYVDKKLKHFDGAYFYSKELVKNILPKVKTDRPFITINLCDNYCDNAVIFIHDNINPYRYVFLKKYKNLILVCSRFETVKALVDLLPRFHVVYLPLSIDTKYVSKFTSESKNKDKCYVGRKSTIPGGLPEVDYLCNLERDDLLRKLSHYKLAYAVGRCLLEAKCLGLKTVNTSLLHGSEDLLDNKEVIPVLQKLINEIDGIK